MQTSSKFCLGLLATGLLSWESLPQFSLFPAGISGSNKIHNHFDGQSCILVGYWFSFCLRQLQRSVIISPIPPFSSLTLSQTLTRGRNQDGLLLLVLQSELRPRPLTYCRRGHRSFLGPPKYTLMAEKWFFSQVPHIVLSLEWTLYFTFSWKWLVAHPLPISWGLATSQSLKVGRWFALYEELSWAF